MYIACAAKPRSRHRAISMNVAKQQSKYMIRKCVTISWRAAKDQKKGSQREPKGNLMGAKWGAKRAPQRNQKGAKMNKVAPKTSFVEQMREN